MDQGSQKHELGDKATLSAELERLKREVLRLQMEVKKDIPEPGGWKY